MPKYFFRVQSAHDAWSKAGPDITVYGEHIIIKGGKFRREKGELYSGINHPVGTMLKRSFVFPYGYLYAKFERPAR